MRKKGVLLILGLLLALALASISVSAWGAGPTWSTPAQGNALKGTSVIVFSFTVPTNGTYNVTLALGNSTGTPLCTNITENLTDYTCFATPQQIGTGNTVALILNASGRTAATGKNITNGTIRTFLVDFTDPTTTFTTPKATLEKGEPLPTSCASTDDLDTARSFILRVYKIANKVKDFNSDNDTKATFTYFIPGSEFQAPGRYTINCLSQDDAGNNVLG